MTTHVFIVDVNTIKCHLEYLFVGTGMRDVCVDFNNTESTSLHTKTENTLLGLLADFSRVKIGDLIIFYLQQNKADGISEGKFYGVFRVTSPVFLDNNDSNQFLRMQLKKSLVFRCTIEAYQVYPDGVTEWEALDEIKNIATPYQMLWSLIYRKLKGLRGNTMITLDESDRLIKLIRDKNNRQTINADSYTFDLQSQKIISCQTSRIYNGRRTEMNIVPRLIKKYELGQQFESHLQVYILQKFYETYFFNLLDGNEIVWLGNEVSCGVGMQRIDILADIIDRNNVKVTVPIELKSNFVSPGILLQMQRYVTWLEQYYVPNRLSDIQPVVVCRGIDKSSMKYYKFKEEVAIFNRRNNVHPLQYVEFTIFNGSVTFERIF